MTMTALALMTRLLAPCQEDDSQLAAELERLSVGDLARLYFIEWGRLAVADLKKRLESGDDARMSADQKKTAEEAVSELDLVYKAHDTKKPVETVARMLKSKNKMVAVLGFKVLTKGTFTEALPILKEVDPAQLKRAEDIIRRRTEKKVSAESLDAAYERQMKYVRENLADLGEGAAPAQAPENLRGVTNAVLGNDSAAWERWFAENERYLACEPRIWQGASGQGLLYVDEQAKAARVPWQEWRKLTAEERAAKLAGKKVPDGWKAANLFIDVRRGGAWLNAREHDNTWTDLDMESVGFAYWLFWEKKRLAGEAPDWALRVIVRHGDSDSARRVAGRCERLGFEAQLAEAPRND